MRDDQLLAVLHGLGSLWEPRSQNEYHIALCTESRYRFHLVISLSDVSSIIDVIYALVRLATAARAPICMHRVRIQVSVTCDNGARAAAEAIAGVSRAYPSQVGAIDTCMTHRFCEMHVGLVAGQGYGR